MQIYYLKKKNPRGDGPHPASSKCQLIQLLLQQNILYIKNEEAFGIPEAVYQAGWDALFSSTLLFSPATAEVVRNFQRAVSHPTHWAYDPQIKLEEAAMEKKDFVCCLHQFLPFRPAAHFIRYTGNLVLVRTWNNYFSFFFFVIIYDANVMILIQNAW